MNEPKNRDERFAEYKSPAFLDKLADRIINPPSLPAFRLCSTEAKYRTLARIAEETHDRDLAASLEIWRKLEQSAAPTKHKK